MSWTDSILANTAGAAFRAFTGNVDPWTLQVLKDDAKAATAQALGANNPEVYGPVDPATLAAAQSQAESSVDTTLKQAGAHPEQVSGLGLRLPLIGTLDLPKIKSLVNGALIVLAIGGVIYFGVLYHKTLGREFRKLKAGK